MKSKNEWVSLPMAYKCPAEPTRFMSSAEISYKCEQKILTMNQPLTR